MSSIFSGLTREERLLPITNQQTLLATGDYRLLLLDAQSHPALYEHVDHHRRRQHTAQRTQQQYLQTVLRSTKVPVRCIAFPDTRRGTSRTSLTTSPTTTAGDAVRHDSSDGAKPHPTALDPAVPRLLAAQQAVRMSSPYERLIWPSLLQSPLVVPWVAETTSTRTTSFRASPQQKMNGAEGVTSQFYNTRSNASSSSLSALSQNTLHELCEMAAQHSTPAQEAILFYSLVMTYLDVVVPSGVPVHALLWDRRGQDAEAQREVCFSQGEEAALRTHGRRALWFQQLLLAMSNDSDDSEEVASPASTVLSSSATTEWTSDRPLTFQALQSRLSQLVLFFQTAAAVPEARTPPSAEALLSQEVGAGTAACSHDQTQTPLASPVPHQPSRPPRPPPRHLAFALLRLAARHWLERRGATVSTSRQLGCLATAHVSRDLQPSLEAMDTDGGEGDGDERGSAIADACASEDASSGQATEDAVEKTQSGGVRDHTMQAAPPDAGHRNIRQTRTRRDVDEDVCFQPCEPRHTTAAQSTFSLSPLPCDPLAVFSIPVCHDALLMCMRDPVALLTLREHLLVETGAQCAALVALRQAQAQAQATGVPTRDHVQQTERRLSVGRGTSDATLTACRSAGDIGSDLSSVLLRSESELSLGSPRLPTRLPFHHNVDIRAVLRRVPFPLLTGDPLSTTYVFYGPQAIDMNPSTHSAAEGVSHTAVTATSSPTEGWRWHDGVGWKGFEGWLLRCYDASAHNAQSSHSQNNRSAAKHSASSSATTYASTALRLRFSEVGLEVTLGELPVSMEELADLCCRLGARLPRVQQARRPPLLQLSKTIQQWILQVFQTHLLDIYLLCKRQRVQAFHLRAGPRSVVLTLLHGDGREEKVGSPGELSAEAHAAAAEAQSNSRSTSAGGFSYAALQLVAESGYEDAALWLKHVVDHRAERRGARRVVEWCTPLTSKSETGADAEEERDRARRGAFVTSVNGVVHRHEVVTLRRAEESVLLRILRCHPGAVYLTGCGVEQIMLDAEDGRLLLQHRCSGEVVPWEMRDCYDMKLAGHPLRTPLQSVPAALGSALPLPQGVPDANVRVGLTQMRGMLRYYHRSVVQSMKHRAERTPNARQSLGASTRAAQSVESGQGRASVTVVKREDGTVLRSGVEEEEKSVADSEVETHTEKTHLSAPALLSPALLSQQQWPESQRTVLFPTDRAMALYVLRHHPQYYSQVRGCGVVEVYVACIPDTPPDHAAAATTSAPMDTTTAATAPSLAAAGRGDATTTLTAAATGAATFLVERACGMLVAVPLECCYTSRPPHTLFPPHHLAEVGRTASSSQTRTTQRSDAHPYGESHSLTPSRSSSDLKRSRPW